MTSAKCLGHRLCIRQWPIWSQFCSIGLIAVRYTRTCPATPTTFWAMTISAIFQHAAVFYFIELTAIIGNGTNTCYDLLKWVYIVFRFLFCCSLLCRILCCFFLASPRGGFRREEVNEEALRVWFDLLLFHTLSFENGLAN